MVCEELNGLCAEHKRVDLAITVPYKNNFSHQKTPFHVSIQHAAIRISPATYKHFRERIEGAPMNVAGWRFIYMRIILKTGPFILLLTLNLL